MTSYDPTPILARFPADASSQEVASYLDVSQSLIRYWRCGRRRLSEETADRIAIRLGLHPLNIWPEWGAA
jgi:hypothetical protein